MICKSAVCIMIVFFRDCGVLAALLVCRGNLAIFQAIKKVMGEYFHDWLPELMPMQMPTWNEIDYSNPALSFPRR